MFCAFDTLPEDIGVRSNACGGTECASEAIRREIYCRGEVADADVVTEVSSDVVADSCERRRLDRGGGARRFHAVWPCEAEQHERDRVLDVERRRQMSRCDVIPEPGEECGYELVAPIQQRLQLARTDDCIRVLHIKPQPGVRELSDAIAVLALDPGGNETECARSIGTVVGTLRWWSSRLGREATPPVVRVAQLVRSPALTRHQAQVGTIVVELLDVRVRVTIDAGAVGEVVARIVELLASRVAP